MQGVTSIDALTMLQPERRAMVTRLLWNLSLPTIYATKATRQMRMQYNTTHKSLKRLGPGSINNASDQN